MISKNITREHILKAIKEVDNQGVPAGRTSRKFLLEFKGKEYPAKYLISIANKYANGRELDSEDFSGGKESNEFLRSRDFSIIGFKGKTDHEERKEGRFEYFVSKEDSHDERCAKCKEAVRKLLEMVYGKMEVGYKFETGAMPEDYKDTEHYSNLKSIYEALQNYRGFKEFVKTRTLPNCDFFIPNQKIMIEFDESQHFTLPRRIALEHYPKGLGIGFDKKKWIRLCETIGAKDNDPPYRDEQRAWYDTLRDFLPSIKGLNPTVRLHSKDCVWCSLNPNRLSDVEEFKVIIKGNLEKSKVDPPESPFPTIGRIIIKGPWKGNLDEAKKLLHETCKKWPTGQKVKFLITCGGFIQFEWPKAINWEHVGDNKKPHQNAVNALIKEAEKCARQVLNNGLSEKLRGITNYVTLGIDSYKEKISMAQNYVSELHIETVFLADLKTNQLYWTGKSYPTPGQQNGLVRITDLKTHFVDISGTGKVMLLGCHDLTMFNDRNKDHTGRWRMEIKEAFRQLAQEEKPAVVLHHPHTTVTTGTWRNGWSMIRNILPTVKEYAGAGRYYEPPEDRDESDYSPLSQVLEATRKGRTIDIVIDHR
jgi:copper chaperone CopZ